MFQAKTIRELSNRLNSLRQKIQGTANQTGTIKYLSSEWHDISSAEIFLARLAEMIDGLFKEKG